MESGNIVEYIDRQKILCAVVLEIKKNRLRLLTETNKEVNLSENRLFHKCQIRINDSIGRDKMVALLQETARTRKTLKESLDITELWDILNTEQEWIDIETMTELCFPNESNPDCESAVIRALFENRVYFKSENNSFFPNSQQEVEQSLAKAKEEAERIKIIEDCGDLLKSVLNDNSPCLPDNVLNEILKSAKILSSVYLFGKNSKDYGLGKAILARAGLQNIEALFPVLVKIGVFNEHENIDLLRHNIKQDFSDQILEHANKIILLSHESMGAHDRKDFTDMEIITIDGKLTLDYDDALSIENHGDHWRVGIHIADVAHFVRKGDILDKTTRDRASSVYMPDQKIPMLPPELAEGACSLKADKIEPAISIMVKISHYGKIIDYEIVPSLIKVKHQLTYFNINQIADQDNKIKILCNIAENFRQTRLNAGAIQINLPEINIWKDDDGQINVKKIDRESPARMLVSELMIMANSLMAKFLAQRNIPAIFRSQAAPRNRLYNGQCDTLFENIMQRKQLSRFMLGSGPEYHSGLGLSAYITATSPIRKYSDLVTQRQIRAGLGLEDAYSLKEIDEIIQVIEEPIRRVSATQRARHRYWLLKYLENKTGQKEKALVLHKRRDSYQIVIPEYMIECNLPSPGRIELQPEDFIQITIQHVDARRDVFSVFMG